MKNIIEIKNIFFPENKTNFSFNNLVSSAELVDNIPTIHQLINSNIQPQRNNHQPLREIINLLDNIQKNRNLDLSNKIIDKFPTFNDKMLPNMVNFIKGSITHSLETWIGKDTIRELSNLGDEGQEVISRLQGVLTTSHREGVSWRIVEIPFYSGEYVNKIRVAVKNFTDDEDSKEPFSKRKNTTRFVVDTSFSKLGKFQFDGFSFRNERRFDLIIRTSQEISDDLYTNIFRLFKTTLNNLEYYGNIRVNVKENFIKVCEDDIHGETLKHGIYI